MTLNAKILKFIGEKIEPSTIKQIAWALKMYAPDAQRLVGNLVDAGLLNREGEGDQATYSTCKFVEEKINLPPIKRIRKIQTLIDIDNALLTFFARQRYWSLRALLVAAKPITRHSIERRVGLILQKKKFGSMAIYTVIDREFDDAVAGEYAQEQRNEVNQIMSASARNQWLNKEAS